MRMKLFVKILSLFYLLVICHIAEAQMQLKTVAVGDSGSVTLQWRRWYAPPSGSNLVLYYATSFAGPYVPVDTLSTSDTVCIHRNANAAAGVRYYFFVSGSWRSDTVATLYMGMENIGGGVANLAWNRPTLQMTNDVPTYTLYRRGFGRDSVLVTGYSYRDTVTVCGDTLEYVVVLDVPMSVGNPSLRYVSPVCRDYFSDFTAPDTARLDSVSLHPERSHCMIGWQPSASKDVFGYIVYIYEEGIWKVMDTLHGASNTFYADTLHADGSVHEYRIAAIDTCRNASPLGEIHHTMSLSASVKKCDSIVDLSWNSYSHMPGGTSSFEVFSKSDSGAWMCVGRGGTETSFRCRGLDVLHSYTFYVRVWNPDRSVSATSSLATAEFHRKLGHGKAYLRSVSVTKNNELEINVFVDDTVDFRNVVLQRSNTPGGNVVWSESRPKKGSGYYWKQSGLDVTRQHYYNALLTDECDLPFYSSPAASNIVLSLDGNDDGAGRLSWSAYDGFVQLPDSFRIYRRSVSESDFRFLDGQSGTLRSYLDPEVADSREEFFYRVSAVGGHADLPYREECFSNIVSAQLTTDDIYIPNSFIPESDFEVNRTFKPVTRYLDPNDYLLTIFDRWGQVVFETRYVGEGWDGTIKGRPAMMGIYVYQLTYRLNNKKQTRRGMVNLIR